MNELQASRFLTRQRKRSHWNHRSSSLEIIARREALRNAACMYARMMINRRFTEFARATAKPVPEVPLAHHFIDQLEKEINTIQLLDSNSLSRMLEV